MIGHYCLQKKRKIWSCSRNLNWLRNFVSGNMGKNHDIVQYKFDYRRGMEKTKKTTNLLHCNELQDEISYGLIIDRKTKIVSQKAFSAGYS